MRASRFPELIPRTIDSSTSSGVAVDTPSDFGSSTRSTIIFASMSISFRDTVVCCGIDRLLAQERSVNIEDTAMSREMRPKRKYELKKRAEEMAETHLRITEAAIELHRTLGPSRTTLSAVAEQAGVERRTLYRHFPTEADLFAACSSHYFDANPWPDVESWRTDRGPQE